MRDVSLSIDALSSMAPRLLVNESVLLSAIQSSSTRALDLSRRIRNWMALPEDMRGTPVTARDKVIKDALEDAVWNLDLAARLFREAVEIAQSLWKDYELSCAKPSVRYFGTDSDGEFRELTRAEAQEASGLSELEFAAQEQNELHQLEMEEEQEESRHDS